MLKKTNPGSIILKIYKLPQTVFRFQELSQYFISTKETVLKSTLSRMVKQGKLQRLRRGLYAKDNYQPYEVANKIYTPSYISFATALRDAGMIFQVYFTIFSASYLTRDIKINNQSFEYHRLKEQILFNTQGIIRNNNINIASPERAMLDSLYLSGGFFIDNLFPINWDKAFDLLPIYNSKKLTRELDGQYKIFKHDYARPKKT